MTALAGTGTLAGLALRRDRIWLSVWILLTVGLVAGTASSINGLYAAQADRQQYAETVGTNPASAVLSGPGFGTSTLGGITLAEVGTTTLVLVALASIMLVVRHTRTEEETGRAELIGSAVTGRHARLAAALLVVGGANLVIAAGTIAALIGYGLPVAGSFAFGLAVAGTGLVFAAVATVAAQFVEHTRTAIGSAAAIYGLAFILRAVGDASATANPDGALKRLSWLSPIGWAQQVRAYGGERWWVVGLLIAATIVLIGAAVALSVRRDVGASLIPTRLGRPDATPSLASPWALAWRLHRGSLVGWTVGVAIGAGVFGGVAHDITDMVGDNEGAAKVLAQLGGAGALVDSYLAWVLGITGVAVAAYTVATVLRLRSEETGLHAEPVLATAVKRWQWAASHLVVAVVGTAVLLVTTGLVVGLVHGLRSGDLAAELPRVLAGALVQAPAALIPAAGAIALFGLLPRLTTAAWLFVVVVLLLSQLGSILQLDQWVMDVSPFAHLPKLPGGQVSATPLIWLAGIAAVLTTGGLVGFHRRDVGTT
jgi:ABC-2 type transport system permease protein